METSEKVLSISSLGVSTTESIIAINVCDPANGDRTVKATPVDRLQRNEFDRGQLWNALQLVSANHVCRCLCFIFHNYFFYWISIYAKP